MSIVSASTVSCVVGDGEDSMESQLIITSLDGDNVELSSHHSDNTINIDGSELMAAVYAAMLAGGL